MRVKIPMQNVEALKQKAAKLQEEKDSGAASRFRSRATSGKLAAAACSCSPEEVGPLPQERRIHWCYHAEESPGAEPFLERQWPQWPQMRP
eukprot:s14_g55.t1